MNRAPTHWNADTADRTELRWFMDTVVAPFIERFDKHIATDDQRFERIADAVQRISTVIEVQTATQEALAQQARQHTESIWMKLQAAGPYVAAILALLISVMRQ
jgi:predicted transcriptional regulator